MIQGIPAVRSQFTDYVDFFEPAAASRHYVPDGEFFLGRVIGKVKCLQIMQGELRLFRGFAPSHFLPESSHSI